MSTERAVSAAGPFASRLTRRRGGLVLCAALACGCAGPREGVPGAGKVLTTVAEIRALAPSEAERGHAVRLRGVVTSYGNERYVYYLQDETGGVRADPRGGRAHPNEVGDLLEIEGVTAADGPKVMIVPTTAVWLGQTPLPEPRRVTIDDLPRAVHDAWRVKVAGVVRRAVLEKGLLSLDVAQGHESFRAEIIGAPSASLADLVGAQVQVAGVNVTRPSREPGAKQRLYVPTFAHVVVLERPMHAAAVPVETRSLPPLGHVDEIRRLTAEQAALEHPVRLRGVVTFHAPPLLFVQDETQGIYVRVVFPQGPLPAGTRVEVEGVTGPGQFAPIVDRPRITVLGTAPLPAPRRVTLEQLLTGAADSQWIELDGLVVRRVAAERLILAAGDVRIPAWIPVSEMVPPPLHLQNARVRVRGVSNVFFNRQRQVAGVGLNVPTLAQVTVTEAAPDPGLMSVSGISSVLRFSPDGGAGRPVRVQGTVVLTRGGHTLYIQDDTGAAQVLVPVPRPCTTLPEGECMQVQAAAATSVRPGDRVDVVGFPGVGGLAPLLQDAVVRAVGRGRIPAPVLIAAAEALRGEHDLERVEIEARLLDESPTGLDSVLTLQSGPTVFTAHLEGTSPLRLRHGSLLRLSGVCVLQVDETRQVRGFRLLLGSRQDVAILRSPPWLRLEHVAVAAALLVAVGLAVHRVRLLQVEAGFKAVTEERARMAREIHDTLQARLVGVLVQLELMACERGGAAPARESLDQARLLVRSGMAEARRLVQNLRSPVLDGGDLAGALSSVVHQLEAATSARIELAVSGAPCRLPDVTENNLLRIGQEALLNAVKHGRAGRIQVDLAFTGGAVRLSVHDDGCGFDSAQLPLSGHFGLLGMHERTEQLGGELQIRSRPGEGTDVRVAVRLES